MNNNITISFNVGKSDDNLREMLDSVSKFADYFSLGKKDALHLRLLAEELCGLSRGLLDCDDSEISVKNADGGARLSLRAEVKAAETAKKLLVDSLSKGKNAAYSGVTGIIKKALDEMCAAADRAPAGTFSEDGMGMMRGGEYLEWSYEKYKRDAELEKKAEEYDSLELSVLERLADDIVVAVRPHRIGVSIIYSFKGE